MLVKSFQTKTRLTSPISSLKEKWIVWYLDIKRKKYDNISDNAFRRKTENFIFEKRHLWLSIIIRTTSQWKSFLMELPASNQREGVSKSSENILLGLY